MCAFLHVFTRCVYVVLCTDILILRTRWFRCGVFVGRFLVLGVLPSSGRRYRVFPVSEVVVAGKPRRQHPVGSNGLPATGVEGPDTRLIRLTVVLCVPEAFAVEGLVQGLHHDPGFSAVNR